MNDNERFAHVIVYAEGDRWHSRSVCRAHSDLYMNQTTEGYGHYCGSGLGDGWDAHYYLNPSQDREDGSGKGYGRWDEQEIRRVAHA